MNVLSVSEFNRAVSGYLEQGLGPVAVRGEVVDYRINRDRLVFFQIKDESSRVQCFALVHEMGQVLEDGMEVVVMGVAKLFQKSGGFHLRVQSVELHGEGALRRAFELTRKKLQAEGVFDEQYKQTLPRFPETIGIITSREAAAYTDVLRILENRWGGLTINLYDVEVQTVRAEGMIVEAVEYFNKEFPVDVLILTRGGGSLEDLQAFNSERVVRAVFASRIPVVVGVGHERDETLAEYAADRRASTPSNAAEMVVPDREDVLGQLGGVQRSLERSMRYALEQARGGVEDLVGDMRGFVSGVFEQFASLRQRLGFAVLSFGRAVGEASEGVERSSASLQRSAKRRLTRAHEKVDTIGIRLRSLDPEAVLKRGYSITMKDDTVVKHTKDLKKGDRITTRLADGDAISDIIS